MNEPNRQTSFLLQFSQNTKRRDEISTTNLLLIRFQVAESGGVLRSKRKTHAGGSNCLCHFPFLVPYQPGEQQRLQARAAVSRVHNLIVIFRLPRPRERYERTSLALVAAGRPGNESGPAASHDGGDQSIMRSLSIHLPVEVEMGLSDWTITPSTHARTIPTVLGGRKRWSS